MPDITYDVGRVSFEMKGAWNLATSYEKLDAVSYNGSLYIAKQDVPGGTAITNTTYWQLAAEKGDKGDTGGVDSVNGQQGDVWFPDSRQLISDGYTTDTEPFLMKGNDSDSDRFELAKKLGNTVGVNQFIAIPATDQSETINGVTFTDNRDGSWTVSGLASADTTKVLYIGSAIPSGRKILLNYGGIKNTSNQYRVGDFNNGDSLANDKYAVVYTSTGTMPYIAIQVFNGANVSFTIHPYGIDLTLWYGSNDRIPSDLLSHPENWGRYYAGSLDYEPGRLENADGSILTSIHRNIWDEEWEVGGYYTSNGAPSSETDRIRTKNYIEVIPNTSYYAYDPTNGNNLNVLFYDANKAFISATGWHMGIFNTPANCRFIHFYTSGAYGNTYNHDITISLYYSGESGYNLYYPYTVLAEADTGSEVLRSAGAVADEKTPDGTIIRRVGMVDLSTLLWTKNSSAGFTNRYYAALPVAGKADTQNAILNAPYHFELYADAEDKSWWISGATIYMTDASSNDATAFTSAISGIYLYYELATPTTEQGTAYNPIIATVKNGVLSWTNTKGIPVGHESHYFENLRKRVEDRLPDPPSADGTYRLTCTISGGVKTYSWEA